MSDPPRASLRATPARDSRARVRPVCRRHVARDPDEPGHARRGPRSGPPRAGLAWARANVGRRAGRRRRALGHVRIARCPAADLRAPGQARGDPERPARRARRGRQGPVGRRAEEDRGAAEHRQGPGRQGPERRSDRAVSRDARRAPGRHAGSRAGPRPGAGPDGGAREGQRRGTQRRVAPGRGRRVRAEEHRGSDRAPRRRDGRRGVDGGDRSFDGPSPPGPGRPAGGGGHASRAGHQPRREQGGRRVAHARDARCTWGRRLEGGAGTGTGPLRARPVRRRLARQEPREGPAHEGPARSRQPAGGMPEGRQPPQGRSHGGRPHRRGPVAGDPRGGMPQGGQARRRDPDARGVRQGRPVERVARGCVGRDACFLERVPGWRAPARGPFPPGAVGPNGPGRRGSARRVDRGLRVPRGFPPARAPRSVGPDEDVVPEVQGERRLFLRVPGRTDGVDGDVARGRGRRPRRLAARELHERPPRRRRLLRRPAPRRSLREGHARAHEPRALRPDAGELRQGPAGGHELRGCLPLRRAVLRRNRDRGLRLRRGQPQGRAVELP